MSEKYPLSTVIGGMGLPPAPKPRGNGFVANILTNFELEQLKKRQTLQTEIMEQWARQNEIQRQFIIDQVTAQSKLNAIMAEYSARAEIAQAKSDEATIAAAERRLDFKLKKKKIDELLSED
jgi:DNA-binding helix-hairpin-helix protein with protein kinase domain